MKNTNHDVPQQQCGFLHQDLMALLCLLKSEDDVEVRVEYCGDYSTEYNQTHQSFEIKHHVNASSISNRTEEMWKTISNWVEILRGDSEIQCVLITTSKASEGSIPYYLKTTNERNVWEAIKIMDEVSSEADGYYAAYNSLSADVKEQYVQQMYVCDESPNIAGVIDEIKQRLLIVAGEHIDEVYDSVTGWWMEHVIRMFNKQLISVRQSRVFEVARACSRQFEKHKLEILGEKDWDHSLIRENMMFIKQMEIIGADTIWVDMAIKDYLSAETNRSCWLRNFDITSDQLSKYDEVLKSEWEREYNKSVRHMIAGCSEEEKKEIGKGLLETIENKDIPLDRSIVDRRIMVGSFHVLSNDLLIGWHPEYHLMLGDDK